MNTDFQRGLRDSLPIMVGIVPFGLILGAQAGQKGMSVLETVLMMGLNYAGGSEFAAVGLWGSPLPVLLIIVMTLMINSRHILMGVAMIPHLRRLPLRKLLPTLFVMTDESWAMSIADAEKHGRFSLPYYAGTAVVLYAVWIACGFFGALAGPKLGNLEQYGFGMAFPAVFLVLMRGMYRRAAQLVPWAISLIVAAAVYLLSPHSGWYVVAGTAAGMGYTYWRGGAES